MKFVKLTMIERETATEGEDDFIEVTATTATTFVSVDAIRSIHQRKAPDNAPVGAPRPKGTRIAFNNGSQFSVTEEIDAVAALIAPTLN